MTPIYKGFELRVRCRRLAPASPSMSANSRGSGRALFQQISGTWKSGERQGDPPPVCCRRSTFLRSAAIEREPGSGEGGQLVTRVEARGQVAVLELAQQQGGCVPRVVRRQCDGGPYP